MQNGRRVSQANCNEVCASKSGVQQHHIERKKVSASRDPEVALHALEDTQALAVTMNPKHSVTFTSLDHLGRLHAIVTANGERSQYTIRLDCADNIPWHEKGYCQCGQTEAQGRPCRHVAFALLNVHKCKSINPGLNASDWLWQSKHWYSPVFWLTNYRAQYWLRW